MSMNMMEIIKGQIGGMVANQIGKKLGMDPSIVNAGIGALLPTILGGLIKQSSTPEGAEKLNNTLDSNEYDGGMFDGITDMISGGGSDQLSNLGGGLISSLFGDKAGAITAIISKLTGMKSGSTSSLLALLLPLVMSFLGKQKRSLGLDAGGMANLLMSQKDEVAKALPGGMAGALGLTSLGFEDTPVNVPASTPKAAPVVHNRPSSSGSILTKLIPLALIALLGYFGFRMLNKDDGPVNPDGGDAIENVDMGVPENPAVTEALGMDTAGITTKVTDVFGGYTKTLQGITNVETAQAAVPEMESLNERLGGISGLLNKLPSGVKETVTSQIGDKVGPIKEMLDKIMEIPGVAAVLKPVVDSMLAKVGALTA